MRRERDPLPENRNAHAGEDARKPYAPPELEDFGTVAELTGVGLTNPGSDTLPGAARGKDSGSIHPDGLD